MIFESLVESEQRQEILCPYFLRYHLRKDGQLTIYEIWISPSDRGNGVGSSLLAKLKSVKGATSIFAKCPTDLRANDWYKAKGFFLEGTEELKSGRKLNLWRLSLT